MSIEAKVVADSLSPQGIRLTTLSLKYPRWIHAEFMTHRLFSRNASSSRAVPRQAPERAEREYPLCGAPTFPHAVRRPPVREQAAKQGVWDRMPTLRRRVAELGRTRPPQAMGQPPDRNGSLHLRLVSATAFDNFFGVRWHPDAQPEIQELARQSSRPSWQPAARARADQWHCVRFSRRNASPRPRRRPPLLGPRAARASYLNHDGTTPNVAKDLDTFAKLAGDPTARRIRSTPRRWNTRPRPTACAIPRPESWQFPAQHGNFRGWRQYRKMLSNEHIARFTPPT
jgi:hypothetical protein